jgi:hypothetical protein
MRSRNIERARDGPTIRRSGVRRKRVGTGTGPTAHRGPFAIYRAGARVGLQGPASERSAGLTKREAWRIMITYKVTLSVV